MDAHRTLQAVNAISQILARTARKRVVADAITTFALNATSKRDAGNVTRSKTITLKQIKKK